MKNRYGFNLYKVRNSSNSYIQIFSERRDVPLDSVEAFLVDLQKLKDECRDENIPNASETALFYRLLPERTIEISHVAVVGKKFSKDWVTLLLCCSATGEKLAPLVIGKYESSRCLRGINHKKLPCSYTSSRNAWMTTSLWSSWLSELNSRVVLKKGMYFFLFIMLHLTALMLNFQTPKLCLFHQIVLQFCSQWTKVWFGLSNIFSEECFLIFLTAPMK